MTISTQRLRLLRGNTAAASAFTGLQGELIVDTDLRTVRVQDGVTAGGMALVTAAQLANTSANTGNIIFSDQTILGTVSNANIILDPIGAYGAVIVSSNVLSVMGVSGALTTTVYGNTAYINTSPFDRNSFIQTNTSIQISANTSLTGITLGPLGTMGFNTQPDGYDFKFNGSTYSTEFYASANFPTGYQFTTPQGLTGLNHTYDTTQSNVSVVRISHDSISVAKFFDNATTQLTGNLVVSQSGNIFGSFSNSFIQTYSNVNSYSQIVAQNINRGNVASTDFVATADNGTDSTYYIDMGITGSNACVSSFFGDVTAKDDGYLYVVGYNAAGPSTGNIGNLILGSTNGLVKTFIGNTAQANVITVVNSAGFMPGANVTYSLGSAALQWKDLWLSNTTFYLGGFPITVTANGVLQVNGSVVSGNYSNANVTSFLANIGSNAIVTTGNVTASYFIGNGALLTGITASSNYGNTNVTSFLGSYGSNTIVTTGNITAGNLTVSGNITDTGALSIITGSNGNISLIPNGTGIVTISSAATATGNITGSFFIGNGSLLTGIVSNATYSNTNVASYLTGNIVVGNIAGSQPGVTLVANTYSYLFSNIGNVSFPGNLTVTANTSVGNIFATGYYYANGTAFTGTGGSSNYSNTNVASYLPTYSGNIGNITVTDIQTTATKIHLGSNAGITSQGVSAIAIGTQAGETSQSFKSVSIGYQAGQSNQLDSAVAIGNQAGQTSQSSGGIAIGWQAGQTSQLGGAVAIGTFAGLSNQGSYSVALGMYAGSTNQANNSIILNASGTEVNAAASGFYVNPIRSNASPSNILYFNTVTNEITYGASPAAGNYSNANVASYLPTYSGNISSGNINVSDELKVLYNGNVGLRLDAINPAGVVEAASGKSLILGANAGASYMSLGIEGTFTVPGNIMASSNLNIIANNKTWNFSYIGTGTGNLSYPDGTKYSGNTVTLANSSSYYWKFNEPAGPVSDTITLSFNSLSTTLSNWYFGTDSTANTWILDSSVKSIGFSDSPGHTVGGRLTFGTLANLGNASANDIELSSVNANAYVRASNSIWKFDVHGALTLPASMGQVGRSSYTNGMDLYNNNSGVGYVKMNFNDQSFVWVDPAGAHIQSTGGTWDFSTNGNVIVPGSIIAAFVTSPAPVISGFDISTTKVTATGNITTTGGYFIGNGALLTGITANANYGNTNVTSFLGSYGSNTIVTTGNISAGYFVGNGALLTGITATANYNDSNVSALLASFGSNAISTTGNITAGNIIANQFGNSTGTTATYTGNITAGNIIANQFGNSTGTTATYTGNVSVGNLNITGNIVDTGALSIISGTNSNLSLIASGTGVISVTGASIGLGNVVTPYPTQSTITTVFIGNNTVIAAGGGSSNNTSYMMNNLYFQANGQAMARNTYASGAGQFSIDGGTFAWNGTSSATANTAAGMGARMSLNSTALSTQNSIGITSAGTLTVQGASGIVTTQTTFPLVTTTATTINFGNSASVIAMGANVGSVIVGNSVGNITAGNIIATQFGNSTGTTATYTGNVTAGNVITTGVVALSGGNVSGVGNLVGLTSNTTITANAFVTSFLSNGAITTTSNVIVTGSNAISIPNLPAFRVYGNTSTVFTGGNTITNQVIDYNQGSNYNNATGLFTAPVAGLYHCYATIRVATNNALNQASLQKNSNNTGANVIAFWETDTNTGTATHFSITGYAKCAVGDTVRLQVILGNVQFDSNDSWGVTFIG